MGLVHDEYSLLRAESILVIENRLVGDKHVYHDEVNCKPIIFHILSSVTCLCWHDLFLLWEKFIFVSFSHYSLVVHAHGNWHVACLVSCYIICAYQLRNSLIHTCDSVFTTSQFLGYVVVNSCYAHNILRVDTFFTWFVLISFITLATQFTTLNLSSLHGVSLSVDYPPGYFLLCAIFSSLCCVDLLCVRCLFQLH